MVKLWMYNVVLKDPETGIVFLSLHKYLENEGGMAAIKEKGTFVCYAMETGIGITMDMGEDT